MTLLKNGKRINKYIVEEDGKKFQTILVGKSTIKLNDYINKKDHMVVSQMDIMHFQINAGGVSVSMKISVLDSGAQVPELTTKMAEQTLVEPEQTLVEPEPTNFVISKESSEDAAKKSAEEHKRLIAEDIPKVNDVKSSN